MFALSRHCDFPFLYLLGTERPICTTVLDARSRERMHNDLSYIPVIKIGSFPEGEISTQKTKFTGMC